MQHPRHRRYERPTTDSRPTTHAIPPALFSLTREHFALVKATHHLSTLRHGLPPSLGRKAKLLTLSVRPAFMNDLFSLYVEDATKRWGQDILEALLQHYRGVIQDAEEAMRTTPMPLHVLQTSVRLVTKWARHQLGRRLKEDELEETLERIQRTQMTVASSAPPQPTESQPARSQHRATQTEPAPFEDNTDPRGTSSQTMRPSFSAAETPRKRNRTVSPPSGHPPLKRSFPPKDTEFVVDLDASPDSCDEATAAAPVAAAAAASGAASPSSLLNWPRA